MSERITNRWEDSDKMFTWWNILSFSVSFIQKTGLMMKESCSPPNPNFLIWFHNLCCSRSLDTINLWWMVVKVRKATQHENRFYVWQGKICETENLFSIFSTFSWGSFDLRFCLRGRLRIFPYSHLTHIMQPEFFVLQWCLIMNELEKSITLHSSLCCLQRGGEDLLTTCWAFYLSIF